MSGSGFDTTATNLDALNERIAAATATLGNFEFPGHGLANGVAARFDAAQSTITTSATAAGLYVTDVAAACREQASIDHGLEMAPTPDDLNELFRQAQASGDPADHLKLTDAIEDRKQAVTAHENSTLGNTLPAAPLGTCEVPSANGGTGEDSEGTLAGEGGTDDATEGEEDEPPTSMTEPGGGETPVTMTEPGRDTSSFMSSGSNTSAPTPLNDNAVSTETSADAMTPTTGAGGQLTQPTQATPGGQPMQMGGVANPAFGPSGGAPGQLSGSAGSRGTPPKNPQRKDDDTTSTAAPGIAGVTGVAGAAAPSSTASTSPGTGASSATPPTAPPTSGAPSAPATGQGGVGGGGLAGAGTRPPGQPMGSGDTANGQMTKPIYRYEPTEPQPGDPDYNWLIHDEDDIDTDKKGAA